MEPLEIHIPLSIKEDNPISLKVNSDDHIQMKIEEGRTYYGDNIHVDTTANWNSKPDFIGIDSHIYVYSDYYHDEETGVDIPAIKIGDGIAYLIDAPFADASAYHINDPSIHVTPEEKEFWNNKVTCYISGSDPELVIFTNR